MIKIENVDVFGWEAAVPIKDFPNYSIDKMGNVYNLAHKMIKPSVSNNGYLRVSLNNEKVKHKRFFVHRLVAEAFIPNPDNKSQVNHIDYNRSNNSVSNLEWCTPLENLQHSKIIEKATEAKKRKVVCITTGEVFDSFKEVSKKLGLSHSNLVACCKGKRKRCGGLEWKYTT